MRQGASALSSTFEKMIAITGATGEVGGRVARLLEERGSPQRMVVRDPARAPRLSRAEIATIAGYHDVEGMEQALAGVTTLFLVSARESADRVDQHKQAVDAAVRAGVDRILYLSFIGAAPDATFTFARHHFETEGHIRSSGVDFTFSRQNLYMDLLPYLGGEEGIIRGPAGDGRVAPVLRDDVAEAIVTMLLTAGHEGATYNLTGPRALTLGEIAQLLSRSGDKAVRYENETLEQAKASRAKYGAPDWEVEGWITTYTAIAAGEMDAVTEDVERLIGRSPVSVEEFLTTFS